jgi:uncharacterized membrane protein
MSLEPLLTSTPVIQVHAFAAISAFVLGLVQLVAPKGTLGLIAVSSFWIHGIRMIGPFSPIHALSIFTLSAGDRRRVHVSARPHHACGGARELAPQRLHAVDHELHRHRGKQHAEQT